MKIILQNSQSKAFFTANNGWNSEIASARQFGTSQELWGFCTANRLKNVQMVVKFEDARFDMVIPFVPESSNEVRSLKTILLVEDSADDVLLFQRAFKKAGINDAVQVVSDGEQCISYLSGEGIYSDREHFPMPRLIVMDVKMPRVGGLEVLRWMNTVKTLRPIPKIILSSSRLDSDITTAYNLGANTYFAKPTAFEDLLLLVKSIHTYWMVEDSPALIPSYAYA